MFNYDENMIVHVKGFVESKDIEILNSFLDNVPVDKFKDVFYFDAEGDEYKDQRVIQDQDVISKMQELDSLIKTFIEEKYLKDNGLILHKFQWTRPLELIRWKLGSFLGAHSDGSDQPEDYPVMKIGSLIYLNDDYEGGELHFNDYNITIKPSPGDLVIFPNHYMHEVFMVLAKGENTRRHTMPTFYVVTIKGDNNE